MATTVFKDSSYTVSTLVEEIDRGVIALPEIQRPFVWKRVKVRNLFDSMYRGFPVGHLLFWETGAEEGTRQIGTHAHEAAPRLMILDGQQRLTSLYSVIKGKEVIGKDYTSSRIRIAFRPRDGRFAVTNAAVEANPEFIPDISVLWRDGRWRSTEREFLDRLQRSKGELTEDKLTALQDAITKLVNLSSYPFKILELRSSVDEEQAAAVFVRINSEGVKLVEADFILTLMSVFWEDGRKELEMFARNARKQTSLPSAYNRFIEPEPDKMLRVVAGLALRRARLRHVYHALQGKIPKTEEVSAELREHQFAALREAQKDALCLTNWHEFLKSVRRAGYCSGKMISSGNNLMFSYLMYLIGRRDHGMDRFTLREAIARWFFMAALSGRYTGSFETQVEWDLRRIEEAKSGDDFVRTLEGIIDTTLTDDYWEIQLPAKLESSGVSGPALYAYHASLVLLDARPLFSKLSLAAILDQPDHAPSAAIERHHLFPRKHLDKIGIYDKKDKNQIANYAFMEWWGNRSIGAASPREYFPSRFADFSPWDQKRFRFWHALPQGWEKMEYQDFLPQRRKLIAGVVRAAFEQLRFGQIPKELSSLPANDHEVHVGNLLAQPESDRLEFKSSAYHSYRPGVPERVVTDSVIKSVAGFLNADGGTLAIGVADDGEVLGVQRDLDVKNIDGDAYVNRLTTIVERSLGALASTQVRIRLRSVGGEQVALVHANPATKPVFAKVSKPKKVFFVRVNNSTRTLDGEDLVDYINKHWPSHAAAGAGEPPQSANLTS